MPWITTAPIPSGRLAKQSWIARMMPSFSALRLAGRLRPTVNTAPDISTLSSAARSAVAAAAAFPIDCVPCRIVMFYNYWRGSQSTLRHLPLEGLQGRAKPLQHLMHVDHDAVGVA